MLPKNLSDAVRKTDTEILERGWQAAVSAMASPPSFQNCFSKVLSELEKYDRNEKHEEK
ncbi:MAG: hypothetical protein HRU09_20885 [Oligoflexales bacterium]|nr:hypothetical protein [Oligoflexales bacterium]